MRNNFKVFFSLDKLHKNGQVDWDEYYQHFLRDRLGMGEAEIARLQENPATISRDVQESLANVKAAWSEVSWEIFVNIFYRDGSPSILILLYFRANHNIVIVHRKPLERNKMNFIFILFRNITLHYIS